MCKSYVQMLPQFTGEVSARGTCIGGLTVKMRKRLVCAARCAIKSKEVDMKAAV